MLYWPRRRGRCASVFMAVVGVSLVAAVVILLGHAIDYMWANAHRRTLGAIGYGVGLALAVAWRLCPRRIRVLPKGPILILGARSVFRLKPELKNARCPRCGSLDLLWHQYNAERRRRPHLEKGTSSVFVRCQDCGNDDYTEL